MFVMSRFAAGLGLAGGFYMAWVFPMISPRAMVMIIMLIHFDPPWRGLKG
jgi:hypothetical protein